MVPCETVLKYQLPEVTSDQCLVYVCKYQIIYFYQY